MFKSKFLQECEKRGFLYQCTNLEELDKQLSNGEQIQRELLYMLDIYSH